MFRIILWQAGLNVRLLTKRKFWVHIGRIHYSFLGYLSDELLALGMVHTELSDRNDVVSGWVRDYGDELYSWATHKVFDEAAAQDLIQETFIAALMNYDSFRQESSPKTWLASILRNKIIDYFRTRARHDIKSFTKERENATTDWFDDDDRWKDQYRPQLWEHVETLLDDLEFESVFSTCMRKLPSTWGSCVQLKYLSSKATPQICQELNITASNLWQILHRAKLQLRHCLELNWFKD